MNNAFGRTRQRRRPTINITSLIDVMFLLLIFFMVSSVFRDTVGLDITLPSASSVDTPLEEPKDIYITGAGQITFGDQTGLSLEELEDALREHLTKEPDGTIALTADAKSLHEDFVAVIDIAKKVGGKKLIIRTQQSKPPEE